MFKVNNRMTRTRCEIFPKLIIKTPERGHWHRSGVFIVNLEHISHLHERLAGLHTNFYSTVEVSVTFTMEMQDDEKIFD